MPLCPQITITPVTVTSTGMTQTSVIAANAPATVEQVTAADAAAAQAAADAASAQATAAAAFAEAEDAYNTAIAANSAASTAQATANGKNKVTYSTSAPGSTANAVGDVWFQYGTTSPNVGRIIAQYIGAGGTSWTQTTVSGLVIANIDAGSITTGTLSVGLGITTGTGTFTVNAVTGALFANSATIQGQVSATSGYFGSLTNGYSITSTGLVGVGSGVIIGGQIQTSSGSEAVILNGSANAIQFKNGGSVVANIVPLASNGLLLHYGATANPSGGTFPQMFIGSSNVSMFASNSVGVGISTSLGVTVSGNFDVSASATFGSGTGNPFLYLSSSGTLRSLYTYGVARTASTRTMIIDSSGNFGTTASTRRKKHEIESYKIDSNALLNLDIKTFKYKPEFDPNQQTQHGFIAEEAQELGLDELIQYDSTGIPDYFAYEKLPIFLLQLIKELKAEIDQLKGA